MGKKSSLTEMQRSRIEVLQQEGYLEKQISMVEHCSKTAVHNLLTKFKNSGCDSDSKRSGRPQKTTVRDDRLLRRVAMWSPQSSSKKCVQHYCKRVRTFLSKL